jgi:3-amino-4-hydroxybenzoic acid synthase
VTESRKISWLDISGAGETASAILEEAIHQRVDGIVARCAGELACVPPTMTRVLLADGHEPEGDLGCVDVLLAARPGGAEPAAPPPGEAPRMAVGAFVEVSDERTLNQACAAARRLPWTLVRFTDPTKIPLEIVLASADNAGGRVVTMVGDLEEAEIVLGVLERGSDGVMLAATAVGEATRLRRACEPRHASVELEELEVVRTVHVGMGDRACVDTCSYLGRHEGLLVGSHARGMILTCSETHPLPYMPTRPFRVNAGAVHSYALGPDGRTSYLSELESGSTAIVVDHSGRSREVVVGRVKIESRPLLQVVARSASGTDVSLTLQDDWHVRVIGPGPTVLNVTELRPGTKVLGHVTPSARHVGYAITEFCLER